MKELDLLTQYSSYFSASETPEIIEVQECVYISIEGEGSPGTAIFYEKKKALKAAAQSLKELFDHTEKAFKVSVLEIFYWYDETKTGFVDIGEFYTAVDLSELKYRMDIRIPEYINQADIELASQVEEKKNNPWAKEMELFQYTAGKSAQVMHLGPFAGELETLPVLQKFVESQNLIKSGMHHEIHLVNFEKGGNQQHLKTILRDPVKALPEQITS